MRVRLVVLGLLLGVVAPLYAQPASPLSQADQMARWGAWTAADQAYEALYSQSKDEALRLDILLRRLSIAEAEADGERVKQLVARIEASPAAKSRVDAQMRTALAQAIVAWRLGRSAEAARLFETAGRLAASGDTPANRMVAYIVATWRVAARLTREGRPSPAAFSAAAAEAFKPLASMPLNQQFDPLDMWRAADWGRFWVRQPLLYMADCWREKDPLGSQQWLDVASAMATQSRASLYQRCYAAADPEAGYAAEQLAIDMAIGTSARASAAEPWLALAGAEAQKGEELLAVQQKAFGGNVTFVAQLRTWEGYHHARALIQLVKGGGLPTAAESVDGLKAYEAALRCAEATGHTLDAIDLRNEEAASRMWLGSTADAERILEANVAACKRLGYAYGLYYARYLQGRLYAAANQLAKAEAVLREAVAAGEAMMAEVGAADIGRKQMLARASLVYDLLVDVLARQGKSSEAAEMVDRQRQAMIVGAVDVSRVHSRRLEVNQALGEVTRARDAATELGAQQRSTSSGPQLSQALASNRSQFYQAINHIRSVDPDYERLVNIRPTSFAKLQSRLPAGTLLVQYFAAADKVYIFSATASELHIRTAPMSREQLTDHVSTVRTAFVEAIRHSDNTLGAEESKSLERLYDALIKPIDDDLAKAKTLVVVPSGILYYLPFSALATRQGDKLTFLTQRIGVVVLTSLELFDVVSGGAPAPSQGLFAFGNPDGSLPGAQQEVTDLAALFKQPHVYMQAQATKSQLLAMPAGTSILHLATHGVLDPRDVNQSYLVVAGAGADGRLSAGEIYGLDLKNVRLVTLSACQTALGGSNPGAEIATLAQAFSVAGSRSMLASLWSVSDRATRTLMVDFYKALVSGKSLAESLRAAQIAMLAQPQTAHPAYWSAFELIGDWR